MRRPLLFICVCLFIQIAVIVQIMNPPPWDSEISIPTAEDVVVVGQVYEKEYRVQSGKEIIYFYLNLFDYSKEADALLFQEQTSKHFTKIICEVRMNDLQREEDGSIYLPRLGEVIAFSGTWQFFSHATNPGEFDLANFYAIEGIGGKVNVERILAGDGKQWYLRETIFRLRQKLLQNLYHTFPQKEASVLAKMLLGDGSGLDKEVRDLYQNNGIVHILSISGLHISMIGMGIYKLLRKSSCPLVPAAIWGGGFIVFYGVLTGFGVSSCRAIGMYLIHMLGEIWGKAYDMITAMGVLAVFLVLQNPKLVYHSGYLLSFASVCGVGLLAPILPRSTDFFQGRPYESKWKRNLKWRMSNVWNGFMVSLSVALFTLPIQLFFFFKIPIYSVFINLLIIPFVSIVMIIGFTVMLCPGLYFLCPLESMILSWFEWICLLFERFPGHTLVLGRPQMWKILVYYVVLICLVCFAKYLRKLFVMILLTVVVIFMGVRLPGKTSITFLDVGQGDCICVQTSLGQCFLFDGGSSSKGNVGEKIIIPYLQYCGISRVDAIFVSHPDEDHTNGLESVLEKVKVGRVVLPQVAKAEKEFEKILAVAGGDTITEYVARGEFFLNDDFRITCLHPTKGYLSESNEYSACYLLETEGINVLMTGDVEGAGEVALSKELKRQNIEKVDILKVSHHGSKYSTNRSFLDTVKIELAIISCGRNNYGHPHVETLERLEAEGCILLSTSQAGAITVEIKDGVRVHAWRNFSVRKN